MQLTLYCARPYLGIATCTIFFINTHEHVCGPQLYTIQEALFTSICTAMHGFVACWSSHSALWVYFHQSETLSPSLGRIWRVRPVRLARTIALWNSLPQSIASCSSVSSDSKTVSCPLVSCDLCYINLLFYFIMWVHIYKCISHYLYIHCIYVVITP